MNFFMGYIDINYVDMVRWYFAFAFFFFFGGLPRSFSCF